MFLTSAVRPSSSELKLAVERPSPTRIAQSNHPNLPLWSVVGVGHRQHPRPPEPPRRRLPTPTAHLAADELFPDLPDLNPEHQKVHIKLLYLFPHQAHAAESYPR